MSKQEELDYKKSELLADLNATIKIIEEIYRYHPDNPNKVDIVKEYDILKQIQSDIELELDNLND